MRAATTSMFSHLFIYFNDANKRGNQTIHHSLSAGHNRPGFCCKQKLFFGLQLRWVYIETQSDVGVPDMEDSHDNVYGIFFSTVIV